MEVIFPPEAWDSQDDWRGIASAKERRRIQNRLHQRAHRKKRHLKAMVEIRPVNNLESTRPSSEHNLVALDQIAVDHFPIFLQIVECMGISAQVQQFLDQAHARWTQRHLILKDLPSLTRLNAFDALIRNASILQIPVDHLETEECSSPFSLHHPTRHDYSAKLPAHLCPTTLQHHVPHHAWLDLFPFPGLRHNILLGIREGVLDEDIISQQLCCDLLNLDSQAPALVVIWGDAWDAKGWEFSPEFFNNWSSLLHGCYDIVQASNHWRARRGEKRIEFAPEAVSASIVGAK